MASQNIPITRMELLKLKGRISLAKKGHSLLSKKRDSLIQIFFEYVKKYKELKQESLDRLQDAQKTLHKAAARNSVGKLKTVSFGLKESLDVEFSSRNVMGVTVPSLQISEKKRPLDASLAMMTSDVLDAVEQYKKASHSLLKVAELEQTLFKIADEIIKTKRRVNALEYIKIPELEELSKKIRNQLAELERESFFTLKSVKAKLEAQENA